MPALLVSQTLFFDSFRSLRPVTAVKNQIFKQRLFFLAISVIAR